MTRIMIEADRTAQEILPFLEAIDPTLEPETQTGLTSASATFDTGLVSRATFTPDVLGGTITVTSAEVIDPDGALLFTSPEPNIVLDFGFNLVNADELEGFAFDFVDAPDRVDARAFLDLTDTLAALLQLDEQVALDALLSDVTADFGDEPEPEGAFDPDNYDTLVLDVARADVTETLGEDGAVTIVSPDGTAVATGLERIEVTDGAYAYGLSEDAPFVYRLYSASLARTPDEGGLRFWDGAFDELTPNALAQQFVDSQEFEDNFLGDGSDEAFIDALYMNVLGREADEGGLNFWLDLFSSGAQTRATMLIAFSESNENIELTAEDTDDGLWVL